MKLCKELAHKTQFITDDIFNLEFYRGFTVTFLANAYFGRLIPVELLGLARSIRARMQEPVTWWNV